MTRAAFTAPTLVGALWAAGLGSLAVITLAHPGSTRMHAWPWSLAFATAVLAPALILIRRAFDTARPLALPAPAWTWTALGAAGAIMLSALASPYQGPSLLWSAPLLGGLAFFFATFDWLHGADEPATNRRDKLIGRAVAFLGVAAATSLVMWLSWWPTHGLGNALAGRNGYTLGHSNYTAGLALLLLPCALGLLRRANRAARMTGLLGAGLGLALLFTSGSRAGVIGLAVLAGTGLLAAPLAPKKKLLLALALLIGGALFTAANPRTREFFTPADPADAPNLSNVQRSAMLTAGLRMGGDRPLLGWGPGTTPLAFPRYRAGLEGGVENALQLHSTPVQLWAELGAAGVAAALALLVLAIRAARAQPIAAIALAGYGVFAVFDWQLDVPIFACAIATLAALLAPPLGTPVSVNGARALGGCAVACLALIVAFGRVDPTPALNARALALTVERTAENDARAVALLRESLALNPDQEIAHSNLAWLLVATDPLAAERHFRAAARLVPDKGGVYFGLGLACLNQVRSDRAARAFALEGLNDPAFLASPYWRDPAIAALREATAAHLAALVPLARARLAPGGWAAAQLDRVALLAPGRGADGPERAYRRTRPGYPVLMRNLDLVVPPDVFVVRETTTAPDPAIPLPPKGWLPSPILVELLAATVPPIPKS
ncbi:MAG: O-antigen ligase family protein [Opitutaceae bacterium]|nr:O-antigen ligase family protein [Opitutaceae bacterium]